jgi:hypothetical protein
MAQAIHHADDHRSYMPSILGARGVDAPIWTCGATPIQQA